MFDNYNLYIAYILLIILQVRSDIEIVHVVAYILRYFVILYALLVYMDVIPLFTELSFLYIGFRVVNNKQLNGTPI